jgi:hypothetical protein
MPDGKLFVCGIPVVPIDDWEIPFTGRIELRDNLPKIKRGMRIEANGQLHIITKAYDWSGYRSGKRIRPRTVYFAARRCT